MPSSDVELLTDDQLEAHVRARVTPEIIEWTRRRLEACAKAQEATTSAGFTYRLGYRECIAEMKKRLETLLTEALDPEFQET